MGDLLIPFYLDEGPDSAGRQISEIWAWDFGRLEERHDYIQWLFPNPRPSAFNPHAPLLGARELAAFRSDARLIENARRSLDVMLAFYGFRWQGDGIVTAEDFPARAAEWIYPSSHNYLRLSRILIFLRLVGLEAEARALLACLEEVAKTVGPGELPERTLGFWRAAALGD